MRNSYKYFCEVINEEKIETNIHFIKANNDFDNSFVDKNREDLMGKWEVGKNKQIKVYNGFGEHMSMFNEEFINKNQKIINEILENILIE